MFFWLKKFVSFWLMPLPLCVSLIAVGIVFLLATRRQRLGRTLLLTGTLLLGTSLLAAARLPREPVAS